MVLFQFSNYVPKLFQFSQIRRKGRSVEEHTAEIGNTTESKVVYGK